MGEAGIDSFQELVEMNATLGCFQTKFDLGPSVASR